MTALIRDRNTPLRDGDLFSFGVAADTRIHTGALVVLDSAGHAEPASTAAGKRTIGRAEEAVDNTGGQAGDRTVLVRRGVFRWAKAAGGDAITIADIGNACFAVDDQTVARTDGTGTRSPAGIVVDVDTVGVWVASGWHYAVSANGGLVATNNLSDVGNTSTARGNLGFLGPFQQTLTGLTSPLGPTLTAEDTVTVTGVQAGDLVLGQEITDSLDGAVHTVRVTGPDQITVRTVNAAGVTLTFASDPVVTFAILRS